MAEARRLLVIGELAAYGLGGIVIGWCAPRPVRTALWGALLALAWAFARGAQDLGVAIALDLVRSRGPQLASLYALDLAAAAGFALLTSRVARPDAVEKAPSEPPRVLPPPVTPPRDVRASGPIPIVSRQPRDSQVDSR
jgi:hypothetical protein